jgi:hypothetical protein
MGGVDSFLDDLDAYTAVVGYVMSIGKIFKKHAEFKEIMNELKQIEAQIDFLQQDMDYYFNKVLASIHQETCYSSLY